MKQLQLARTGYIGISILFYCAAAVYLLNQSLSQTALCCFSGIVLIVYGIIKVIGFFSDDLFCLAFQYDLAVGILMLVLGIIVLVKAPQCAPYLPIGLGWIALLDSLLKIQMSKDAKQFGLERWKSILVTAIITGAASVLLICLGTNRSGLRILTACVLAAEGILNHYVVVLTVKLRKKSQ